MYVCCRCQDPRLYSTKSTQATLVKLSSQNLNFRLEQMHKNYFENFFKSIPILAKDFIAYFFRQFYSLLLFTRFWSPFKDKISKSPFKVQTTTLQRACRHSNDVSGVYARERSKRGAIFLTPFTSNVAQPQPHDRFKQTLYRQLVAG